MASTGRIITIAWKDVLEFVRDKRSLAFMAISAFLFPLLGLMITGLKTQQAAPVAILVCDRGAPARETAGLLYRAFSEAAGLRPVLLNSTHCGPQRGYVATIAIPRGFSSNYTSLTRPVHIVVYRTIGNPAADEALQVASTVVSTLSQRLAAQRVEVLASKAGIHIEPDVVLQPLRLLSSAVTPQGTAASPAEQARASTARFLAFAVFFVLNPAAIAVADSVSRERESGTGEVLAITPVSGGEFVAGKILGSLAAAAVAGGLDLAAATAYAATVPQGGLDAGLVLFHAFQTIMAILVTAAFTILITLLMPGQRAATLVTSAITGLAIMVFFSVLFVDIAALPPAAKAFMYLIPYTHTALAIEQYALGNAAAAALHTALLAALTAAAMAAAARVYKPERMVKRQ